AGIQPLQLTVAASIALANVGLAIPLATPQAPYVTSGATLTITGTLTVPPISAQVNLSLLEATATFSGVDLHASVVLAPGDVNNNGRLELSELVPTNVTVTPTSDPVNISITASIRPGIEVSGSGDLNGASATLTLTAPSLLGGDSG